MIEIREARDEDRESVKSVLWKAFEATETFENMRKQEWLKEWHRPDENDWAYVAVEDDRVVANFCFFVSEKNIIRGNPIKFAGIWGVATDPLYRSKGLIRGLFAKTFPIMREKGAVLSILDPFYKPFYEKFDYALAEKRARHIFKKDQLREVPVPAGITWREAKSPDDIETVMNIEKEMTRFGSRFFTRKTSVKESIEKGNLIIVEKDKVPVGTIKFLFTKGGHPGYEMTIGTTRYKTEEAVLSMMEIVRNYVTNSAKVNWYTDYEVPIRHFFKSHKAETHTLGSMMMRVIDFEEYCRSINIPENATEEIVIDLYDEQCPWNSGIYTLKPNDGKLEVSTIKAKPEIKLNAFQLSKVISGLNPITLLRNLHEIDCSIETAQNLEAIFPIESFIAYQRF